MSPTTSDYPTFQIAFGRTGEICAISLNLLLSGCASALYLDLRGATSTNWFSGKRVDNARQRLAEKSGG